MADLDKVTLPSGSTYNLKDTQARQDIETLKATAVGAVHYIGVTTTALSDGADTNPITINGESVTAKNADYVIYGKLELIFSDSDSKWHEYGSTGSLKALAFKDSATGKITPAGSVSQPTFTGTAGSVSVTGTPSGSVSIKTGTGTANYTPSGSISQPSFTGSSTTSTGSFTPAGTVAITTSDGTANYTPSGTISAPTASASVNTTTVNSITGVGTLPSCALPKLSMTVQNETLTFGWDAGSFNPGTLPTKGANQTVATGVKAVTVAAPTFTGTGVDLEATFTGTAGSVSVTGTPKGSVSKPTFTGTGADLEATFTGASGTSTGTFTPSGTVSKPTFTGAEGNVTVS